jgi:protein disulfide-isomerase A1
MKYRFVASLVLTLVIGILSLSENAVTLTKSNFDKVIKTNDLVMVEFYAPWCGHCKHLAPVYDEAAKVLESKGIILAKVDATAEEELAQRFGIRGYPTLKVFQNGAVTDYKGERTASAIVEYLTKLKMPALRLLNTKEEVETFKGEGPVVIGFAEPNSELEGFMKTFSTLYRDEFSFGQVSSKELAVELNEQMGSTILFKPYDDLKNVYTGEMNDASALIQFLKIHKFKVVDEITPMNYKSYVSRNMPFSWLFLNLSDEEESKNAKEIYENVAKGLVGKFSFVYLSGETYKSLAEKLGLSGDHFPGLAIENSDGQHFLFNNSFDEVKLKEFYTAFLEGTIAPIVKSQPIPENPYDDNHVRIVVADNFKEVVLDESKDVLIEFYAPWCGHCKKLEPIYGALATDLKDVQTIVFAKTDATENDYSGEFKVSGFPTIRLVTAVTNRVIEFDQDRTREGFLEFLQKNCALNFEMPSGNEKAEGSAEGKDEL